MEYRNVPGLSGVSHGLNSAELAAQSHEKVLVGLLNSMRHVLEIGFEQSDAKISSLSAELEAARADAAQLRDFANDMLGEWPEVGGLDGFDLQEIGLKRGMLQATTRHAPCREEGCNCGEMVDADEWKDGVVCYSKTALLMGGAAIAQEEKP